MDQLSHSETKEKRHFIRNDILVCYIFCVVFHVLLFVFSCLVFLVFSLTLSVFCRLMGLNIALVSFVSLFENVYTNYENWNFNIHFSLVHTADQINSMIPIVQNSTTKRDQILDRFCLLLLFDCTRP